MTRRIVQVVVLAVVLAMSGPALAQDAQGRIDTFLSNLSKEFDTVLGKTVSAKLNAGENLFVLDVREADEFKAGHIEGAVNIPIRSLAKNLSKLPGDKATPIVVACKSGIRAAYATMALNILGYSNVRDVQGGMLAWEKDALPVVK